MGKIVPTSNSFPNLLTLHLRIARYPGIASLSHTSFQFREVLTPSRCGRGVSAMTSSIPTRLLLDISLANILTPNLRSRKRSAHWMSIWLSRAYELWGTWECGEQRGVEGKQVCIEVCTGLHMPVTFDRRFQRSPNASKMQFLGYISTTTCPNFNSAVQIVDI